jgi:hypothetical protein
VNTLGEEEEGDEIDEEEGEEVPPLEKQKRVGLI